MSKAASRPFPSKTALRWEGVRALSRRWIQDAAGTVFAEEGFESATMKRIAEVCGVTKATIYAHYRNKAQLYKVAMDGHLAALPSDAPDVHGTEHISDALMRISDATGRLAANPTCLAFCQTLSRSAYASDVYMKKWTATLQPYLNVTLQALAMASVCPTNVAHSEKFVRLILAEHGLPQGLTPVTDSEATVVLFSCAYGCH